MIVVLEFLYGEIKDQAFIVKSMLRLSSLEKENSRSMSKNQQMILNCLCDLLYKISLCNFKLLAHAEYANFCTLTYSYIVSEA